MTGSLWLSLKQVLKSKEGLISGVTEHFTLSQYAKIKGGENLSGAGETLY